MKRAAGVVVYRMRDGVDAIDQYSRHLVAALDAHGVEVEYVDGGSAQARPVARDAGFVLLQYQPFSYGRWGVAPGLVRDIHAWRRLGVPLAIMIHEAWMPMEGVRWTLMGLYQRAQLKALMRIADTLMTSTQLLADTIGHGAVAIPVGSNITPLVTTSGAARRELSLDDRLVVSLFGRGHPGRALDYAEAAVAAIAGAVDRPLTVLNLGVGAPPIAVPTGVELLSPGWLTDDQLSVHLWASDLVLLPFVDGLSTRRTTLMAALDHRRCVLGLEGAHTDGILTADPPAVGLTPVGDIARFAEMAVTLASDDERRAHLAAAGAALYANEFSWPVIAERVAARLATVVPELAAEAVHA